MFLSTEDARSDVILAGAAAVFGGVLIQLLLQTPGIPRGATTTGAIALVATFALSGLVPYLLARYRQDVPGAFGFVGAGGTWSSTALLLAAPLAAVGVARGLLIDGSPVTAALGRVGRALTLSPALGPAPVDVAGAVFAGLQVVVLVLGSSLLIGFLTVRGRDAFRTDERSAVELVRTIGGGALGVALLVGLLTAVGGRISFGAVLLNVAAGALLLAVVDRTMPARAVVTRPAVLTPVVLVVVAHVFDSGGIFRGGLTFGLYAGGLAAATVVAMAVALEQRRQAAALLPLLVAVHWWPSCLSPLPPTLAGC